MSHPYTSPSTYYTCRLRACFEVPAKLLVRLGGLKKVVGVCFDVLGGRINAQVSKFRGYNGQRECAVYVSD